MRQATEAEKVTTYSFIKEGSGWYIDLPEYLEQGGSKGDLAMVAGADTMLDLMSEGQGYVKLEIEKRPFPGADELTRLRLCAPVTGGADYLMKHFEGKEVNHEMWLCDVMLFVFNDFPERIFVRRLQ